MRTLLLFLGLVVAGHLPADITALAPVNVISMTSGEVQTGRGVLIEDGRIVRIVAAGDEAISATGTRIIDGNHGWLIPGLAEMHAHVPPRSRGEQHARDMMVLFLANGVTTIRGMLGEPWHLELRELLAKQDWDGPRLVTSGPSFNGNSVSSPEQAAARVRAQAESGYDFLKLHPGLEPDEFTAIADTARSLGIPFAGHVSFAVGLDAALQQRQDTIDHLDSYAEAMVPADSELHGTAPSWFGLNLASAMDPELAPALASATAAAGVWNVPTQSLFETTAGEAPLADLLARTGMEFMAPGTKSRWQQSIENIREQTSTAQRAAFLAARHRLLRELQAAGAGLLLGSDAPQIMNVPGFSTHQELEYLVNAGLTPLQALQSGTLNVARFFNETDRGEIAENHVADFILLEANPLEDIRATNDIIGVMRSGIWYDREALDSMLEDAKTRGL